MLLIMLNSVVVESGNVIQNNYKIERYQLKCRTYHFPNVSSSITEHSPTSDSVDESTSPDTTVESPIADIPRSGCILWNGQSASHGLNILFLLYIYKLPGATISQIRTADSTLCTEIVQRLKFSLY